MQPTARQTVLIAAGLILLVVAVRLPLLGIPFERDEGEYAYIGWRLGHNELPYRDWVDQKPPAIFWVYRTALSLPLDPVRSVHFAALLFAAASSCALFFVARRMMNQFWAFVTAALFSFLSADPFAQGTAANTEQFMLLPLILSQIAFFKSVENARNTMSILLCGALVGIAIAFKQVAAVNWFLLVALYPIFAPPEKRWRGMMRFAVLSLGGLLAVLGLMALYFWIRAGLSELVQNVITHNLEYIGAMTWSDRIHFCADTLGKLAPTETLVWLLAFGGLLVLILGKKSKFFAFLVGWLITSAIGISASGYFFPHYFQQWLPPLALLSVIGLQSLELVFWKGGRFLRAIVTLLLVFLLLKSFAPFWFKYSSADAVRKIYPGNFFAEMPEFAARLARLTSPDQRVFIFGAEPEVLFYARRVSATRYIFLFPLYGPYRGIREKQIATANEIQQAAPAAAVYVPNAMFFDPGTDQYFTEWSLSYFGENFLPDTWLIKETEDRAGLVPARSDLPPPHHLLGAIFGKKPGAP